MNENSVGEKAISVSNGIDYKFLFEFAKFQSMVNQCHNQSV